MDNIHPAGSPDHAANTRDDAHVREPRIGNRRACAAIANRDRATSACRAGNHRDEYLRPGTIGGVCLPERSDAGATPGRRRIRRCARAGVARLVRDDTDLGARCGSKWPGGARSDVDTSVACGGVVLRADLDLSVCQRCIRPSRAVFRIPIARTTEKHRCSARRNGRCNI